MRIRVHAIIVLALLSMFAVAAAAFLHRVGQEALDERNDIQFYADSNTYHRLYEQGLEEDEAQIEISRNYLGPLLLLRALDGNIYLVMLLNVALFAVSLLHITRLLGVSPLWVTALLFLSPLTVSTLLSVNKEILVFPFVALALHGYMRRSWTAVALAFAVSLLVRWQLGAFYLVMLLSSLAVPVRVSRRAMLGALLLAASGSYLLLLGAFEQVLANVELSTTTGEQGSGLYSRMLSYQNRGLYFLVFPVKALHLLFGLGFRLDRLMMPGNLYNDFFVLVHCQVTFLVAVALAWRRRLKLRSDLVFASIVFLIVFCLTPVFAPRYLYPVFLLWVLVLAGAPAALRPRRRIARAEAVP